MARTHENTAKYMAVVARAHERWALADHVLPPPPDHPPRDYWEHALDYHDVDPEMFDEFLAEELAKVGLAPSYLEED